MVGVINNLDKDLDRNIRILNKVGRSVAKSFRHTCGNEPSTKPEYFQNMDRTLNVKAYTAEHWGMVDSTIRNIFALA